jgi:hypothetical protein
VIAATVDEGTLVLLQAVIIVAITAIECLMIYKRAMLPLFPTRLSKHHRLMRVLADRVVRVSADWSWRQLMS